MTTKEVMKSCGCPDEHCTAGNEMLVEQAEKAGFNVPAFIAFCTKYGATGWAVGQDLLALWGKYGDTLKQMIPDFIAIFAGGSAKPA